MTDYSTKISRTGRVQNWIDDPESRLPVSCTVFVVEDSMEGADGIEASWRFVSHALRNGAGVAVHLSKLRPSGADNGRGLVSSGPVSFARIYSALNETLRRGGVYKNGAVVCHLDINHPDILEFANADRSTLPWIKRCVDLTWELWDVSDQEVRDAIIAGIKRGDIWLNKIRYEPDGTRIYGNVCLEVYLRHRGTCLLQHVNLGACKPKDLVGAFIHGMQDLIDLHAKTGVGETGEYLDPFEDRQVGLGVLGLANFLKLNGVTYEEFGDALERYHNKDYEYSKADDIVDDFADAIDAAEQIARGAEMVRAFAIAPTASCSYRSRDLAGYASTPEIAPPISRAVDRDSGTFGVQTYFYGDVEIASEVGWDNYYRVVNGLVRLFQETGLFHGYSFNSWSDVVTYDEEFVEEWLDSPQTSLYYSLQVMDDTQDKSSAMAALGDDADALLADLFAPLSEEEEAAGRAFKSEPVQPLDIRCIGCEE
jgi:ribonucleotide reductase alpha subunit